MIPLRDTIPSRRTAWITRLLLVLNVLAFAVELRQGRHIESFLYQFGVVPAHWTVSSLSDLLDWPRFFLTLITSQFLHGSFSHLGANMLYLWIFADNVEDVSTRRALIESAKSVEDNFQSMEEKIRDYRTNLNEEVVDTVDQVNNYIRQIAGLNQDIMRVESGGVTGVTANDLRDQRTQRLKELAGLMDITVTEESNGSVIVTQKSRLLVFEQQFFALKTIVDSVDAGNTSGSNFNLFGLRIKYNSDRIGT